MGGGVFFVKSGKLGDVFVISGPFLDAGCIIDSISILFYILLIWECVRTQRTPLPTGLRRMENDRLESENH